MRRANPAVIGGFILGAVLLVVAGVTILGSGKLFAQTLACVMYFEGDIQGLQVGARVNFRGVKIGSVTAIKMRFDPQTLRISIPVVVEFPRGPRGSMDLLGNSLGTAHEAMAALIRGGLRAQLQTESLVTGLLFVQLDLYPASYLDAPPAREMFDRHTGLLQIPTVPTTLQELSDTVRKALDKLAELPLEQMLREIQESLSGINRLVNAPEVRDVIRNANVTLTEARHLMQEANQQVKLVGTSATDMLAGLGKLAVSIQQLGQSTQQLVQRVDTRLDQVAGSASTTLGSVNRLAQNVDRHALALTTNLTQAVTSVLSTLEQMGATLTAAQRLIAPNAPIGHELLQTLRQVSEAARSVRELTDYLERNPSSVIFGRRGSGAR